MLHEPIAVALQVGPALIKPALEWVMERQCVKIDKATGIVNDANLYAVETVSDPAYPNIGDRRDADWRH
jgi:hypothetical protein